MKQTFSPRALARRLLWFSIPAWVAPVIALASLQETPPAIPPECIPYLGAAHVPATEPAPSSTAPLVSTTTTVEVIPSVPIETEPATSTERGTTPLAETPSSTPSVVQETGSDPIQPPAPTPPPSPSPPTPSSPPLAFTIEAIMANPAEGKEFFEVRVPSGHTITELHGWRAEDRTGTILSFTQATLDQRVATDVPDVWRFFLASAKLNNDGDDLKLVTGDGTIMDHVLFGETTKGVLWTAGTTTPVPETTPAPPPTPPVSIPEPPITPPETTTTAFHASATHAVARLAVTTPARAAIAVLTPAVARAAAAPKTTTKKSPAAKVSSVKTTAKKTVTKKTVSSKKPAAKKVAKQPSTKTTATKKSSVAPPVRTDLDSLHTLTSPMRVELHGTVGSIPGLLAKHTFVIHAQNGRGLLIKGNGKQPSPAFGASIVVTGLLTRNDDGLLLKMEAADRWETRASLDPVQAATPDLFQPGMEDAYSFVDVTGIVREVKRGSVAIDAGDIPLTVVVKPILRYRAERIKPGDTIRIRGLLHPSMTDDPRILPRSIEEITIVRSATVVAATKNTQPLPGWTPIGVAGATLAASHGFRKLRALHEQRRATQLLAQLTSSPPASV